MRRTVSILTAATLAAGACVPPSYAAMPSSPAFVQPAAAEVIPIKSDKKKKWYKARKNKDDDDRRHARYRDRDRDFDDDDDDDAAAAFALGVIGGLATGAIVGSSRSYGGSSWAAACARKYRSFDPRTGTYVGYDGYRHPCRL